jgi:hypothetical protein
MPSREIGNSVGVGDITGQESDSRTFKVVILRWVPDNSSDLVPPLEGLANSCSPGASACPENNDLAH